jgi:hypothetical protein
MAGTGARPAYVGFALHELVTAAVVDPGRAMGSGAIRYTGWWDNTKSIEQPMYNRPCRGLFDLQWLN